LLHLRARRRRARLLRGEISAGQRRHRLGGEIAVFDLEIRRILAQFCDDFGEYGPRMLESTCRSVMDEIPSAV